MHWKFDDLSVAGTSRLPCVGFAALGLLQACGSDVATEEAPLVQMQVLSENKDVRIAEIRANGGGCRPGTRRATVSSSGDGVVVEFRDYGGQLSLRRPTQTDDCTLSIVIEGEEGLQFVPQLESVEGSNDGATLNFGEQVSWASAPNAHQELKAEVGPNTLTWSQRKDLSGLRSGCDGAQELRIDSQLVASLPSERRTDSAWYRVDRTRVRISAQVCAGGKPPVSPDGGVAPDGSPGTASDGEAEGPKEGELPSSGLTIRSVYFGNEGCLNSNTKVMYPPDRTNLLVSFGGFSVVPRADFAYTDSNCTVGMNLAVPAGHQFAIESFSASGTATLGQGASAQLSALTSFTGMPSDLDKETQKKLVGPYDGPFSLTESRTPDKLSFSRCGDSRAMNVLMTIFADKLGVGNPTKPPRVQLERFGPVKFAVRPCQ